MIQKFKVLFTDPQTFYKELKEQNYSEIIKFLAYILFIPYLLYLYFSIGAEAGFTNTLFLRATLLALLTITLGPFFSAAMTHIGVKIFKKSGYKKTFHASGYALSVNAPYMLAQALIIGFAVLSQIGVTAFLSVATIISFIGVIHVIITEVYGLKELHKLSTLKAVTASIIIPAAIVILVIILLVIILLFLFMGVLDTTQLIPPA